jgi:hypothetical protein
MQSLKQRIQPLLTGRLSLSELDQHTQQAFRIYLHFRSATIIESMNPDQIRKELEKVPESVREEVRRECLRQYKRRLKSGP